MTPTCTTLDKNQPIETALKGITTTGSPVIGDAVKARVPLTPTEHARFEECTVQVRKGMRALLEVGEPLKEIRENRLYRAGYKTFAAFCRVELSISRNYADRLIAAWECIQVLKSMTTVIKPESLNENQVRELIGLDKQQLPAVIEKAKDLAGSEPMTSRHYRLARQTLANLSGTNKEASRANMAQSIIDVHATVLDNGDARFAKLSNAELLCQLDAINSHWVDVAAMIDLKFTATRILTQMIYLISLERRIIDELKQRTSSKSAVC